MTINIADNTPRVSYNVAQGVTQSSFTVTFEFFDNEDLNVYVDGTLKTLTTDYTVTGGDGSTGSVSISVTGASGGSTVVITRAIALERTTDFPASGAFQIDSLNTELDRITAVLADINDEVGRSLRLTDYDTAVSLVLPDVDSRKGTVLAFDSSTGAVVAGPTTSGVNTLASIATDVATLADIEDGTVATDAISNLAAIDSDVTAVANITSNVTTVAGVSSNVTTVAGISSDVTTVAGDSADIQTVAANIATINTKADAGANSDITSLSGITGNVDFADNAKAQFGAGNDLQIFHDSTNSVIKDVGTGHLYIAATDFLITNSSISQNYITAVDGGAVTAYHSGSAKLATTSTGVTVTGTAIATTDTDTTNTGSVTLDFGANQNFVLTLTGNVTLANPTTEQVGQSGFIVFIQDATGGRTVSLGTDYETAGGAGLTLSTDASTTDIVPYVVAASGRILLGAPQLAFS